MSLQNHIFEQMRFLMEGRKIPHQLKINMAKSCLAVFEVNWNWTRMKRPKNFSLWLASSRIFEKFAKVHA